MDTKRLLIVDDTLFMRQRIKQIAEEAGWQVDRRSRRWREGRRSVSARKARPGDLGHCDAQPGWRFSAATNHPKRSEGTRRYGQCRESERANWPNAFEAGAIDFIVKPFEKDSLRRFFEKHLTTDSNASGIAPLNSGPTTLLIVDDSALYRQSIHNVLRDVDGVRLSALPRMESRRWRRSSNWIPIY